jgi:hypothetical protein
VLQTLETVALVLAVGAHVSAAAAQRQQLTAWKAQQQQQEQQRGIAGRRAAQVVPPPAPPPTLPQPGANLLLTLPLVAALLLGRLRSWLAGGSARCAVLLNVCCQGKPQCL